MSDDKVDYGEVFCEAVDTIIAKRLDKLEFDVTKTCRIIDDTHKKQGKYTVTDNSIKFEAYSTLTTLNINDSVLVNIPSGDYSKQKTILNKIVGNDISTSFNYKSPLANLLKFTDNIVEEEYLGEFSILANDKSESENANAVTICEIKRSDFSEYEKMGVSVNIKTWLSHFHLTSGVYGLRFEFFTKEDITLTKAAYSYDLNIYDVVGDPYGFNTYTRQEKVFNISYLKNVDTLIVSLYQQNNFIDENGQYIPWTYTDTGLQGAKLNNNIFIKDLNIFFGSDVGEFTQDTLQISTPDIRSYSAINPEEKTINLKWIHKIDDNNFEVLDKNKIKNKVVEFYWCRYVRDAQEESPVVAEWCGPNWSTKDSRLFESERDNPFQRKLAPDGVNAEEERIKVVCRLQDDNGEWHLYESKILDFVNTSYIIDQKINNKVAGLSIDFTDGSEGNYFIYNQNGEIINEGKGQGYLRKLVAKFDGKDITSMTGVLGAIDSIQWTLPIDNDSSTRGTMLTYKPAWISDGVQNDNQIQITRMLNDVGNKNFAEQNYSIKNNWHEANSNNTITCKLIAGDQIYTKTVELNFSKAGSSGTNITLKLDYENDDNAFEINADGTANTCVVTATMYDMAGTKITSPSGTWKWGWYHSADDDINVKEYLSLEEIVDEEKKTIANKIQLTKSKNYDIIMAEEDSIIPKNNFHILKVTFIPDDKNTQVSTNLTTYMPIAIKQSNISYMEGTRTVIYGADGTLTQSTYTDAYTLYNDVEEEQDITWDIIWDNTDQDGENETNIPDSYGPSLQDLTKNGEIYKALKPSPIFVQGYNDRACVYAYRQEEDGTQNVLWSQPLLIMQSQYDFAMVNDWTGGAQVGENFVMATALGAGRKDESNAFSGIIIGDLKKAAIGEDASESQESKYEKLQTGLFGISSGSISFSLTDDGIATFGGTEGCGKAQFGGDTNLLIDKLEDTIIDIDNGLIKLDHEGKGLFLSKYGEDESEEKTYMKFTHDNGVNLINFSDQNYLLTSVGSDLQVDLKNGVMSVTKNDKTLTFNNTDSSMQIGPLSIGWDGSLSIGTKFSVSADGTIYYNNKELTELIQEIVG